MIYRTNKFKQWQKKEEITDNELIKAIKEIRNGLIDADLRGNLIKKRIPREGTGKSSGYRTIIATNKNNVWIFILGFAKNDKDNISTKELKALKLLAENLLTTVKESLKKGIIEEVSDE